MSSYIEPPPHLQEINHSFRRQISFKTDHKTSVEHVSYFVSVFQLIR